MANVQIPATITEQIEQAKEYEISYRVLHPSATLHDNDSNRDIIFPFSSILNKYKDFLFKIIIEMNLSEEDILKYEYKPKLLSEELYGTTELWDTILILNGFVSVSEFKPKKIKVYDPNRFKSFINEIMFLEESLGTISF